jgi:predicted anti-sigma-YlaC factor YlaD
MTLERNNMTCEEFQAQMAEIIGTGEDASMHPHVQSCELCRALLRDLETIAEAARQLFPVEDPSDTIWEKLESAIKQEDNQTRS